MPYRRITVRLVDREILNEIAVRSQRTIVWILGEAIADAATASAYTRTDSLASYATPPAAGTFNRTTIAPSPAMLQTLEKLHTDTGLPLSVVVRAAWSRWLDLYSVDDIAASCGGIRPALERATA